MAKALINRSYYLSGDRRPAAVTIFDLPSEGAWAGAGTQLGVEVTWTSALTLGVLLAYRHHRVEEGNVPLERFAQLVRTVPEEEVLLGHPEGAVGAHPGQPEHEGGFVATRTSASVLSRYVRTGAGQERQRPPTGLRQTHRGAARIAVVQRGGDLHRREVAADTLPCAASALQEPSRGRVGRRRVVGLWRTNRPAGIGTRYGRAAFVAPVTG
ncbi:hypothetical protein AB0M94_36545 [Streptomyces xanthochromogenes]|uniref:hypothetical protein n=1 Tax=Streptomyces xanthochromogenes TaxID=67384 RepID=UPI003448D658